VNTTDHQPHLYATYKYPLCSRILSPAAVPTRFLVKCVASSRRAEGVTGLDAGTTEQSATQTVTVRQLTVVDCGYRREAQGKAQKQEDPGMIQTVHVSAVLRCRQQSSECVSWRSTWQRAVAWSTAQVPEVSASVTTKS